MEPYDDFSVEVNFHPMERSVIDPAVVISFGVPVKRKCFPHVNAIVPIDTG